MPAALLALLLSSALGCGKTSRNPGEPGDTTGGSGAAGGSDATSTDTTGGGATSTDTTSATTSGNVTDGVGGSSGVELLPHVGCARQLASGRDHTCVLFSDGRVSCLGSNEYFQLGTESTTGSDALRQAPLIEGMQRIAAGDYHTCASDGHVVQCWGSNLDYQLGFDSVEISAEPYTTLAVGMNVEQIATGARHSCYLDPLGHAYCWGTGDGEALPEPVQFGQIGNRPGEFLQLGGALTRVIADGVLYDVPFIENSAALPTATPGAPHGIVENAIFADHDCLLEASGTVWCQGAGYPENYTVVTDFGQDLVEVEVGDGFACVRTEGGRVLCHGKNDGGQLGNGNLEDAPLSTPVAGIDSAVEISLGAAHACARIEDGSVWCWGTFPGMFTASEPVRIAGSDSSEPCDTGASVPRPFNLPLPETSTADEFSDASSAWGYEQCVCAFSDSPNLEDCILEETRVLWGCLEALANDAGDDLSCLADGYWSAAACARASCIGGQPIGADCTMSILGTSCGVPTGAEEFCRRNSLPCDGNFSELRASFRQTCNGVPDCANGFDEANCTRGSSVFTCADGSTIARDRVFDEASDCPDGSDEWL